VILEPKSV